MLFFSQLWQIFHFSSIIDNLWFLFSCCELYFGEISFLFRGKCSLWVWQKAENCFSSSFVFISLSKDDIYVSFSLYFDKDIKLLFFSNPKKMLVLGTFLYCFSKFFLNNSLYTSIIQNKYIPMTIDTVVISRQNQTKKYFRNSTAAERDSFTMSVPYI